MNSQGYSELREPIERYENGYLRDRGDHFKVVGLKNLANTKKHSARCFAIYLAFARHLIYHLKVHTCYTIQCSQYVKLTFLSLLLFEVVRSAKASLAILIVRNQERIQRLAPLSSLGETKSFVTSAIETLSVLRL